MSLWILVPLLFLTAVGQATLSPLVEIAGFTIDVALILVVVCGMIGRPGQAAVWGFVVGMFLDLTSGLPFGTQTIALTGIGLLMQVAQLNSVRDNLILPPVAMIAATFVYDAFLLFVLSLLNPSLVVADYMLRITLPSAIINMLALPLVYIPFQWVSSRMVG